MFTNENTNAISLPLQLRDKSDLLKIAILDDKMIAKRISTLLVFALKESLTRAATSIVRGEVELIYFDACKSLGMNSSILMDTAEQIATVAHTIHIYGHKLNQNEVLQMLGISSGIEKIAQSDKTITQIIQDRENLQKYVSKGATASREAMAPVAQAMMFAGMGKVNNITEPAAALSHLSSLLSLLRKTSDEDPYSLMNYVALSIYLAAVGEYDSGIFTSKISLAPQGLYQAKMIAMIEYAHMLSAVAATPKVISALIKFAFAEHIKNLLNLKTGWRWTAAMQDKHQRLDDELAKLSSRHSLLPFSPFKDAINNLRSSLDVDMILPADVFQKPDLLSRCEALGKYSVSVGEESLYLPIGEPSVLTESQLSHWFISYSRIIDDVYSIVQDLSSGIAKVQLSEDMKPRLQVDYPTATAPSYFKPRFSTIMDKLPVSIGLRKFNKDGSRTLSPYINGVMSYRQVHDRLAKDFPVSARLADFDYSAVLNVHPALVTFPIPSIYLKGEAYGSITLRDETMTAKMQEGGLSAHISYAKAIQVLLFKLDPKYFRYYAALMSGCFIVIMKDDENTKTDAFDHFVEGYKYIKPGVAPFSTALNDVLPDDKENKPLSYGIPAEDLVSANVAVWQKIVATDSEAFDLNMFKRWVIWSDDSLSFGLIPLTILPAPRETDLEYKIIDGRTVILSNSAKFDKNYRWIQQFHWSNIFSVLPQMTLSFVPSDSLDPISHRIGITGNQMVIYSADIITRPDPSDLQFSPQPWAPAPTTKASTAAVSLNSIQPLALQVDTDIPKEDPPPVTIKTEKVPVVNEPVTSAGEPSASSVVPEPPKPEPATEVSVQPEEKKKKKKDGETDETVSDQGVSA